MADHPDKIEKIKEHWQNAARSPVDAGGLRPTARDPFLQDVIETAMERFLSPGAKLLDLGCGDGLSTLRFAKVVGQAWGVDYVADFVRMARVNAIAAGISNVFLNRERSLIWDRSGKNLVFLTW